MEQPNNMQRLPASRVEIIGLSPNLHMHAIGHYLPFHYRFFQVLKGFLPVQYWGSDLEGNDSSNWFQGLLPRNLSRPIPTLRWSELKGIHEKGIHKDEVRRTFFVYEGSLFWAMFANRFVQRKLNGTFLVNLFNSRVTAKRLSKPIVGAIWKSVYRTLLEYEPGRLIFTYDNSRYGSLLKEKLGSNFIRPLTLFPSINISDEDYSLPTGDQILIVVRGREGREILAQIAPKIKKKSTIRYTA